jgi:hypothetical protein
MSTPDQPISWASGVAVPFRPKVLTMDVIHRAIGSASAEDRFPLSRVLYLVISSDMAAIATGVLKESQRAS